MLKWMLYYILFNLIFFMTNCVYLLITECRNSCSLNKISINSAKKINLDIESIEIV